MVVGVPLLTSAKTKHLRGYEHSRGKEISVSEPLGWPVLVSDKAKGYLDASIESLPGMTVLKVKGYTPWWQFWGSLPATTTISVVGFPTNTKLHVYTRGYRDHEEVTTNNSGQLILDVPTKEGRQFIIKAKPSTYHINIDTLFGPPGGDCNAIGTWDAPSKTCTLTTDVNRDGNRTIAIEDDGITLDGAGHKVIGVGSDDGVYTDMSNVTVKNLDVSGFARGIVYVASHGLIFSPPTGGTVQSVTLANLSQNLHIEGMSDLAATNITSIGADTGLFITDLNLDGFPTYGITVTGSTIKNASTGAYIDNVDPITLTQNNWQGNGTDLTTVSSGLILALLPQRGNYWSKFTACTQDPAPANPNHCTNRYDVPGTGVGDTLPWACKDGWKAGMVCPVSSGGGGTGTSTSEHTVPLYTQRKSPHPSISETNTWFKQLYAFATSSTDKLTNGGCGASIESCGCNLVSGVMALKYFAPALNVDPLILNNYLKNPPVNSKTGLPYEGYTADGGFNYITGTNIFSDGKLVFDTDEFGPLLANDYVTLDKHLSLGDIVLGRTFKVRGSHYFIIEQKKSDSYLIRDPWFYDNNILDENFTVASTSPIDGKKTQFDYTNQFDALYFYSRGDGSLQANLHIYFASPIDFVVTDPLGRKLGRNPVSGTSYDVIPKGNYSAESIGNPDSDNPSFNVKSTKDIYVTDPIDGQYTVDVYGTGTGSYLMSVYAYTNGGVYQNTITGDTLLGKAEKYNFVLNSQDTENILITKATSTDTGENDSKVNVCHRPPGNPVNAHTINVGASAVQAHLAHGDSLGVCDKKEELKDDDERENKEKDEPNKNKHDAKQSKYKRENDSKTKSRNK